MPLLSFVLFSVAVIGFGAAFSLTNIAVSSISPLWVAAGRSLVALVALGVFLLLRGRPIAISKALVPAYLCVGVLTGVAPYILISWGQQFIPSSLGGVLFASVPLLTLLFGFTLFKVPQPSVGALVGAVIGLGGVALAFASPDELTASALKGATATVLAAASYAIGGLILQRQNITDMAAFSTVQLVPASIILVIVAWTGSEVQLSDASSTSWMALAVLGLVGTGIPLLSLFALVGREGAKTASLTTFFIPFVALMIGVFFLDELLSAMALLGLLISLAGAYWMKSTRHEN
jgi:drug/metabolite transporter (DMT)-like permease